MNIKNLNNDEKFESLRSKINDNFIELKTNIEEYVSAEELTPYIIQDRNSFLDVRNKLNSNFLKMYEFLNS